MKWPWRKEIYTGGEHAEHEADIRLNLAKDRWGEVHQISSELRRRTDPFADKIIDIMRGTR